MAAPIILFTYNRPWHTRETVTYLQRNHLAAESELIVYADGPKSTADEPLVTELRNYLKQINGFKRLTVIERPENFGLARNIIAGVTKTLHKHDAAIVVEDDLITSPWFLTYMNDGLTRYAGCHEVASIHGYVYPVKQQLPEAFFIKGADCWGWATWKRAWKCFEPNGPLLLNKLQKSNLTYEFDFNGAYPYTPMLKDQIAGKNDSWAIRWYASAFLNNMITLYPGKSLVHNIGNDASGTHSAAVSTYDTEVFQGYIDVETEVTHNFEAFSVIADFLRSLQQPQPAVAKKKNWLHKLFNR
ncbi:Glycosyl transferase family 2 [Parapedobacter indicus]|uniref:Glycosyl transferase family 2 n=1 Tax=Parapedobacter indicus TaxID=1477437 RepID=A0A1I3PPF1_9SPHI|nr:glycosyltransferase [Parapedobacter indicus]PPL00519.1 glycosyl transferase family 2 [Parapedobacter indicus]SFJ23131.1 Glycosyl transferase family 2 [Parapedobacter indicus]